MDIKALFDFLTCDYGLACVCQEFPNYCGSGHSVCTYSFYNSSGCFTIRHFPPRGELDFYCAPAFSNDLNILCSHPVDISSIEKDVWSKHSKIGFLPNPFFWWNDEKILLTLANVLKIHLEKEDEFFGIRTHSGCI